MKILFNGVLFTKMQNKEIAIIYHMTCGNQDELIQCVHK